MLNLHLGKHMILVEIETPAGYTYFKKYPVASDGTVTIHAKGGAGNFNPPVPQAYWEKSSFPFGKKRYARYRMATKRFMTHADDSPLPISIEEVNKLINKKAYNAYFDEKEGNMYHYITLAISGCCFSSS